MIDQLRPIADAVDQVAQEDEIEAVLTPHPRLLHIIELEAAIRGDPKRGVSIGGQKTGNMGRVGCWLGGGGLPFRLRGCDVNSDDLGGWVLVCDIDTPDS